MSSPFIWAGNFAKSLKQNLNLNDKAYILPTTTNPSSVATNAPRSSLVLLDTGAVGKVFVKQDNGSSTNWTSLLDSNLSVPPAIVSWNTPDLVVTRRVEAGNTTISIDDFTTGFSSFGGRADSRAIVGTNDTVGNAGFFAAYTINGSAAHPSVAGMSIDAIGTEDISFFWFNQSPSFFNSPLYLKRSDQSVRIGTSILALNGDGTFNIGASAADRPDQLFLKTRIAVGTDAVLNGVTALSASFAGSPGATSVPNQSVINISGTMGNGGFGGIGVNEGYTGQGGANIAHFISLSNSTVAPNRNVGMYLVVGTVSSEVSLYNLKGNYTNYFEASGGATGVNNAIQNYVGFAKFNIGTANLLDAASGVSGSLNLGDYTAVTTNGATTTVGSYIKLSTANDAAFYDGYNPGASAVEILDNGNTAFPIFIARANAVDKVTITSAGLLSLATPLAITSGGTGSSTASGARSNLGAAASGANSDITSMTGLTGSISSPTFIDYVQIATPANPAATHDRLYFKSDDKLYGLNSSGVETLIGPSTSGITGSGTANQIAFFTGASALSSNANLGWDGTIFTVNGRISQTMSGTAGAYTSAYTTTDGSTSAYAMEATVNGSTGNVYAHTLDLNGSFTGSTGTGTQSVYISNQLNDLGNALPGHVSQAGRFESYCLTGSTSGAKVGLTGVGNNSTFLNLGGFLNGNGSGTYQVGVHGVAAGGTNNIGGHFALKSVTSSAYVYSTAQTTALLADNADSPSADIFIGQTAGTNAIRMRGAGSLSVEIAGQGIMIKEGSDAKMGVVTLGGTGSDVVSNINTTANSRIFLTRQAPGGTTVLDPFIASRVAGTSFTIGSTIGDTSVVAWIMFEPS